MAAELKEDGDWVPTTPAKTVQEYSPVDPEKERSNRDCKFENLSNSDACIADVSLNSGFNVPLDLGGGVSGKVEYKETGKVETPPACIRGIQLKNEQARINHGSHDTTAKVSSTQSHQNSEKLSNCGVRLNKKRRPKMKKHRPKVVDETESRRTPKSKTVDPFTPKQKTPKRVPKTSQLKKRKRGRKKNSKRVVDGNLVRSATNSCRQRLDFSFKNNVRDQHGCSTNGGSNGMADADVMETSFAKVDHIQLVNELQHSTSSLSYCGHAVNLIPGAVKCFTYSLDDRNGSSLGASSLEDTLKMDFNLNLEVQDFDSCSGIREIIKQCQGREESGNIVPPEKGPKIQNGDGFSSLKVYKRIFRPNECLKNSRKLGPNFPRIYKRTRTKQRRATPFHNLSCMTKVASKKRHAYHIKKFTKRGSSRKLANQRGQKRVRENELCSDVAMIEYNLRIIQPSQCQIMAAMTDPKSFNCVRNLLLMTHFRKKRTRTPCRMHEEMKHRKPKESILYKWKGCKTPVQSHGSSTFCIAPTTSPLKALGVGTTDIEEETFEDCVEKIPIEQIPYLDAHTLIRTPSLVGQHLDLKHMFSNLNADEVKDMIDFVSQIFERLSIADINYQIVVRDQETRGALLPYKGKFHPSKRRKLVPKVDLDPETLRVWELLMENDRFEAIEEVDSERQKKWDDDREIFCGRIDSFISCMHLIQGDRRFSPWKGSVVDSVVGVFLTQNVSDHLSSSAFMSLAAKYPPSVTNQSDSSMSYVSHQESIDGGEVDCGQSANGNEVQPSLCSTEQDMKKSCISPKTKTLSGDVRSCQDAVQCIPDTFFCQTSTTVSQPCAGENSAIFMELLHLEDNALLQKINNQEENKISYDQITVDSKFGNAVNSSDSSSCKRSVTISRPSVGENPVIHGEKVSRADENALLQKLVIFEENKISCDQCRDDTKIGGAVPIIDNSAEVGEENALPQQLFSHEENKISSNRSISDVEFGYSAPSISVFSTSHESSATSSKPCTNENSSIFRKDLLLEENKFLQQFRSHEDTITLCDKSVVFSKFRASHSNTCALNSDKSCDLDCNSASSTGAQNLIADLGNIDIKDNDVSKNHESVGGRNKRLVKEKQESPVNWDDLRKEYSRVNSKDSQIGNIDSANWEAVRRASVEEVAKVIMERGMNNILAGRIKDFLDRMIHDHGTIDLEWLRDVPPDKAKKYLLSIPGLGLKSTECVRLLTLRHHAFPVDTNVGRVLVRLGWVPLLPLPEDVQIHLLNQYPLVDSIQKYIWTRLCKIPKETLYECHYQMITFGKVFCTKRQPNCNACPMRGQCRHFASAYASARLRLPGVQRESNKSESQGTSSRNVMAMNPPVLVHCDDDVLRVGVGYFNSEPIIEFPPSPDPACREMLECDIEDLGYEIEDEIPTIKLNQEEFMKNIMDFMENTNFLSGESSMSKELVALSPKVASIPMPKLKYVDRLRTVHQVYELPDPHPLLEEFGKREPDDPCPYLLAIWINEETAKSSQLPADACSCQESTCGLGLCNQKQNDELIQGTILIPCRTANRGSFPLNGTYFQVNEVFADHDSSHQPILVPRKWIWNLRKRSLYCGTSTTSIFRGMTTDEIQFCFWRGFICVRGTDRATRAPKPLARRFHICKTRQRTDE